MQAVAKEWVNLGQLRVTSGSGQQCRPVEKIEEEVHEGFRLSGDTGDWERAGAEFEIMS